VPPHAAPQEDAYHACGVLEAACGVVSTASCFTFLQLGQLAEQKLAPLGNSGAMADLAPNSPFPRTLNGRGEPFPRAGIVSLSDQRWVAVRLMAEWTSECAPEDPGCSGQAAVNTTADWYSHARACEYVYITLIPNPLGYACRRVGDAMDAIDRGWHMMSHAVGDPTSDGISPGSSQRYPGIAEDRLIFLRSGPSHVGETGSPRTYVAARQLLARDFRFDLNGF
jgi:hypothetical protein